jgi:hypothetical protein
MSLAIAKTVKQNQLFLLEGKLAVCPYFDHFAGNLKNLNYAYYTWKN